jgi:salicylate hydroxylase
MLVIGESAHASTPHHGLGAGFYMENVAVLPCLLKQLDAYSEILPDDLNAVFAAFDTSRRQRDQWLVESSRRAACVYEWQLSGTAPGHFDAMQADIQAR